jgi:serine/threonine-protein kinase
MSDEGAPRRTRLYGAVDLPDYPPTLAETGVVYAQTGLAIGEQLERYRIEDVLGRGGMGEVLSARDDQIGRAVAIKRLRIENPSEEVLARFLREVRIQGRLEHPAVVPVHELHTDGDQPFFVMKQVAGTTLADVIEQLSRGNTDAAGTYTRQQLLRAFYDVCLAIEFAHTKGVVHRDLKPANIVLGDFGEVYVLDWGIARVADEDGETRSSFADVEAIVDTQTIDGQILGTPGYISPEQIEHSDTIDGRADVYSLGCILFELLALEPLHPRGQGAIASALTMASARPSERAAEREIPPELDEICVRATALKREDRYRTARELGQAVQHFLDGHRDNALRNELARAELDIASRALATGTSQGRRTAMRAAARALALDPTYRHAADLVGHLMLEPPKEMPPEVQAELDQVDMEAVRKSARFGTFAALAYPVFWALMYWVGFREIWYHATALGISLTILVTTTLISSNHYWPRYVAILGNLAMFGLFSIVTSPVIMGPGPPIVMIVLLAAQRRLIPLWLVAVLSSLAMVSPWLLELAGVIGPVISVQGNDIILHTMASDAMNTSTALVALIFYIVSLAQIAGLLARLQDDDRRKVRRTMQLQTWQLRQLVPRATTLPPER